MSQPRTVGELRLVLIWSKDRRAWWRPDGMGYTTELHDAGLYDADTVVERYLFGDTRFHQVVKLGATQPRQRRGNG